MGALPRVDQGEFLTVVRPGSSLDRTPLAGAVRRTGEKTTVPAEVHLERSESCCLVQ